MYFLWPNVFFMTKWTEYIFMTEWTEYIFHDRMDRIHFLWPSAFHDHMYLAIEYIHFGHHDHWPQVCIRHTWPSVIDLVIQSLIKVKHYRLYPCLPSLMFRQHHSLPITSLFLFTLTHDPCNTVVTVHHKHLGASSTIIEALSLSLSVNIFKLYSTNNAM